MQLISKAMVDGSLESLSERLPEMLAAKQNREPRADGNRAERRAAAAIERKNAAKRKGEALCAR